MKLKQLITLTFDKFEKAEEEKPTNSQEAITFINLTRGKLDGELFADGSLEINFVDNDVFVITVFEK